MGYSNIAVHVQIEKSQILNFFLHLHSEKKAYHTGSAFTQQKYACQVSFVLNTCTRFHKYGEKNYGKIFLIQYFTLIM